MPKRNGRQKEASGRERAANVHSNAAASSSVSVWYGRLQFAAAFLLGLLLFWAFAAPFDSTSVFSGDALAQNLFWLALAVLVSAAAAMRGGFEFPRLPVWLCVTGLSWLILCTIQAGATDNARVGWNGFWQVMAFASCYFSVRGLLFGPKTRYTLIAILIAGCVAMSCQGLYQVAVVFPNARAEFERDPDAAIAKIPNLYAPEGSPQRQRYIDRLNSPEPLGTYALANSLGTLLSMGLVLLLGLGWLYLKGLPRDREPPSRPVLSRWLTLGGTALTIAIVWLLTRSRTAYLATLLGLGYMSLTWLVLRRKARNNAQRSSSPAGWKSWSWLVLPILLVGGGFGWLFLNDALVLSEAPKSLRFRLEYWYATANMIADHGLQGVGLGNFRNYYTQYKLPTASEEIADPHNWILDIAATLSVPIALLVLGWLTKILTDFRWAGDGAGAETALDPGAAAESRDTDSRISAAILLGLGVGGLVCGLMLNVLSGFDWDMLLVGWIPAGFVLWLCWRETSEMMCQSEQSWRWLCRGGLATILICLLANGSWQATGLGIPVVMLAALSLASRDQVGGAVKDRTGLPMHTWALTLPSLGFLVFILQAWRPVVMAWMQLVAFESATTVNVAERAVQEALAADPLDAQYQELEVEVQFRKVAASPVNFETKAKACLQAIDAWLEMDQNKFSNWRTAGHYAADLAARAESLGLPPESFHKAAVRYSQQAVRLYPTHVELRLQLALNAALAGQRELYLQELAEAERLSELTPHWDKKLETQLIRTASARIPAEIKGKFGLVEAELLIQWLRTNESSLFENSSSSPVGN